MINNITNKILAFLRSILMNGLLFILPIVITYGIVKFFFVILRDWLRPIYELEPFWLKEIPGSEIILVLIFAFLIGAVSKFFLIEPLINYLEDILNKIPLLRPIYFGVKQIVHAFTSTDALLFQQVVFVEFPRPGIYSIGFLTSELPPELAPDNKRQFYSIYIPTTPNPMTGYYICVPQGTFIKIDLTRQEAMALIISGGIIQPERFSKKWKTDS